MSSRKIEKVAIPARAEIFRSLMLKNAKAMMSEELRLDTGISESSGPRRVTAFSR